MTDQFSVYFSCNNGVAMEHKRKGDNWASNKSSSIERTCKLIVTVHKCTGAGGLSNYVSLGYIPKTISMDWVCYWVYGTSAYAYIVVLFSYAHYCV